VASPHGEAGRLPADDSKTALGSAAAVSERTARDMARKALALARGSGRLAEAADLMEEAFNKWPELRDEYEYQLKLWRRGIAM
jgi:serine/threonine-protein kinase